ncbi:unnamed protein product [Paramecium octaurelia]|uniref:Transmembrane protein n=1 Tax=Paramecium octaurelia TaxID=43137 RepID=A0A8S1WEN9_PAROT|nr:unnamed protein product [Paramecium octaurelia]
MDKRILTIKGSNYQKWQDIQLKLHNMDFACLLQQMIYLYSNLILLIMVRFIQQIVLFFHEIPILGRKHHCYSGFPSVYIESKNLSIVKIASIQMQQELCLLSIYLHHINQQNFQLDIYLEAKAMMEIYYQLGIWNQLKYTSEGLFLKMKTLYKYFKFIIEFERICFRIKCQETNIKQIISYQKFANPSLIQSKSSKQKNIYENIKMH